MLRKTTEQGRNKHQPGDKEGAQNSRNKGELSLSVASAATTSREMKLPGKRTLHTRQNKGTLNTHQLSFQEEKVCKRYFHLSKVAVQTQGTPLSHCLFFIWATKSPQICQWELKITEAGLVFSRDSHYQLGGVVTHSQGAFTSGTGDLGAVLLLFSYDQRPSLTVSLVLSWKQVPKGQTDVAAEPCLGYLNHPGYLLQTVTFSTEKKLHAFAVTHCVLLLALSLWVLGESIVKFVSLLVTEVRFQQRPICLHQISCYKPNGMNSAIFSGRYNAVAIWGFWFETRELM